MTSIVQVDPKDVATALALEAEIRAFQAAVDAAQPALKRLEEAGYAGAESLSFELGELDTESALEVFEDFRIADGDHGAYDYRFRVIRLEQTLNEACAYFYKEDEPDRVEPMRRYAESIAS